MKLVGAILLAIGLLILGAQIMGRPLMVTGKIPTWFVCMWPGGDETVPWKSPFGIVRFQLMSYTDDLYRPIPLMYKSVLWEVTKPDGSVATKWDKTDDNGWVDYPFYYDSPGAWKYKVTFQGDDKYAGSTGQVTITVLPPESPPPQQQQQQTASPQPTSPAVVNTVAGLGLSAVGTLILLKKRS